MVEKNESKANNIEASSLIRFITLFEKMLVYSKEISVSLPLEQFEDKIKSFLYSDVQNPKSRIVVKFAYRLLFITKLKIRVKKANKRIHERKMRIFELIEGERKYINGLSEYIQYIKVPIC